jgi:phosphoribosyl-AMP cyclohydrolase
MSRHEHKEKPMDLSFLKFDDRGLIPAIAQEADTGEVLMMGWANEDAIRMTFDKSLATFWSRSRDELWTKGETSGNRLHLVEVRYDCDSDVLLYRVRMEGSGACHTGERTCFYRVLTPEAAGA